MAEEGGGDRGTENFSCLLHEVHELHVASWTMAGWLAVRPLRVGRDAIRMWMLSGRDGGIVRSMANKVLERDRVALAS